MTEHAGITLLKSTFNRLPKAWAKTQTATTAGTKEKQHIAFEKSFLTPVSSSYAKTSPPSKPGVQETVRASAYSELAAAPAQPDPSSRLSLNTRTRTLAKHAYFQHQQQWQKGWLPALYCLQGTSSLSAYSLQGCKTASFIFLTLKTSQ